MSNYCECGKTYKSENFPCICDDCEGGDNNRDKVVKSKTEITFILQRIRGMKNDLCEMENVLLRIGSFDWKEVAQFNKFMAMKLYKEKFSVDLKTARDEVENFLEIG